MVWPTLGSRTAKEQNKTEITCHKNVFPNSCTSLLFIPICYKKNWRSHLHKCKILNNTLLCMVSYRKGPLTTITYTMHYQLTELYQLWLLVYNCFHYTHILPKYSTYTPSVFTCAIFVQERFYLNNVNTFGRTCLKLKASYLWNFYLTLINKLFQQDCLN